MNATGKDKTWYHAEAEPTPPEFRWGPLEGTAGRLAASLYQDRKPDERRLRQKVINGVVWVKRINARLFSAWLSQQADYERALKWLNEGTSVATTTVESTAPDHTVAPETARNHGNCMGSPEGTRPMDKSGLQ